MARMLPLVALLVLAICGPAPALPVQWPGNSHWYEAVVVTSPYGISWEQAELQAEARGGYLATITSAEENALVFGLVDDTAYWNTGWLGAQTYDYMGPWIGAYRESGVWHWVTGEAWGYTDWGLRGGIQEPTGDGPYVQYYSGPNSDRSPYWNDCPDYTPYYAREQTNPQAYVVEWDDTPPAEAEGGKLVFSYRTEEMSHFDIWTMNIDGTDMVNLTNTDSEDEYEPDVSPDGSSIAYVRVGSSDPSLDGIYVVEEDGASPVQVVSTGDLTSYWVATPVWRDKNTLLFNVQTNVCESATYQIELPGGTPELLFSVPDAVGLGSGAVTDISPDGSTFVVAAQDGCWAPTLDLYLVDATTPTTTASVLYEDDPDEWRDPFARWSPDGTTILFCHWTTAGAHQNPECMAAATIEPDGSSFQLLTGETDFWYPQDWSPDGGYILALGLEEYYTPSPESWHGNLWVMDTSGQNATQVTSLDGHFPVRHYGGGADPRSCARWYQLPAAECIEVPIDIKPGSIRNPVNPGSRGVLPAVVFSTTEFDAATVDPDSLRLAGASVFQDTANSTHYEDINGDGLSDLVVHFDTEELNGMELSQGSATLVGNTYSDDCIQGRDAVTLVPFHDLPNDDWAFDSIAACVASGIVKGYDDGTYGSSLSVTRDQMGVYISRAMAGGDQNVPDGPSTATFNDVPTDQWAYAYIEYVVSSDVVIGYDDGLYHPADQVDRGQMAAYIARSRGWVSIDDDMTTASEVFPDVPAGFWSGTAVQACVANDVVHGYDDGYYRPQVTVTRDQMAVYVQRAFELLM